MILFHLHLLIVMSLHSFDRVSAGSRVEHIHEPTNHLSHFQRPRGWTYPVDHTSFIPVAKAVRRRAEEIAIAKVVEVDGYSFENSTDEENSDLDSGVGESIEAPPSLTFSQNTDSGILTETGYASDIVLPFYLALGNVNTQDSYLNDASDMNEIPSNSSSNIDGISENSSLEQHDTIVFQPVEVHFATQASTNMADVDQLSTYPLHKAVLERNVMKAQSILSVLNVNQKDFNGDVALNLACAQGNVEMARVLLDAGAEILLENSAGHTSISIAIESIHAEIVQLLLDYFPDAANAKVNNIPLLHIAVKTKSIKIVQAILATNPNINAEGPHNMTALHIAALSAENKPFSMERDDFGMQMTAGFTSPVSYSGVAEVQIMELLIHHGANVDAITDDGSTALMISATKGNENILSFLVHKKANLNLANHNKVAPLHELIRKSLFRAAELILSHGADSNCKTDTEETPLYIALKKETHSLYFVNLLLRNNADPNLGTKDKMSPLMHTVLAKNDELALFLIRNKANVNAKMDDGMTVLHMALSVDQTNVNLIKELMKENAMVNAQTLRGLTPLHLAARLQSVAILRLLIFYGANLNTKTNNGLTPLHMAVQNHRITIVNALIAAGCALEQMTKNGITPLTMAVDLGLNTIQDVLISALKVQDNTK